MDHKRVHQYHLYSLYNNFHQYDYAFQQLNISYQIVYIFFPQEQGLIFRLQLLNSQEKEGRNIFTGSFGFIKFNMDMRFNIIIRSILNFKNVSEISAASGVVLDSSSKKEFSENYIKAKSLLELFK